MWKIMRLEILSVKQETVITQLFEQRSFNIWIINYNTRLIIKIWENAKEYPTSPS